MLSQVFDQRYYGIALPFGSKLRKPLNQALLSYIESQDWKAQLERYLGR